MVDGVQRLLPSESLLTAVAGPLLWFVYFLLVYGVVSLRCGFGIEVYPAGVDLAIIINVALTVAVAGLLLAMAVVAFRRWRRASWVARSAGAEPGAERQAFLALTGLLLNLLSLVATLWVGLPVLMVPVC